MSTNVFQVTDIVDPNLRAVADRVYRTCRLAMEKVTLNHTKPSEYPLPDAGGTFEAVFQKGFARLAESKRAGVSLKAQALVHASPAARRKQLGDLADLDLSVATPVEVQASRWPMLTAANWESVKGANTNFQFTPGIQLLSAPVSWYSVPPTPMTAGLTRLELRLHQVTCVDETNGFLGSEAGSDEIWLGGSRINASGELAPLTRFKVGDFARDGVVRSYAPPRVIAEYDLSSGPVYPRSFFAVLALAEADGGGFPSWLNELATKVRDKVVSMIGAIAGAALGGPLGAAVGAAVGWVIDRITDLIRRIWEDDIFPPATVSVVIPSASFRWPGGATDSPEQVVEFSGHGGRYRILYDWRLIV